MKRFIDDIYTAYSQTTHNYAQVADHNGQSVDLALDFYEPDGDAGRKRPTVIVVHGKGGGSARLNPKAVAFAKKGFNAVTVNYRGDGVDMVMAMHRAAQDVRAALRYVASPQNNFNVKRKRMFLFGSSMGATAVIHAALSSREDPTLGDLDSSGAHLDAQYKILGLGCSKGAHHFPVKLGIPTVFFHGTQDKSVPFDQGHLRDNPIQPWMYGSHYIYQEMISKGLYTQLYINCGGTHSDHFVDDFVVNKAGRFFRNVLKGKSNSKMFKTDPNCDGY
jgi:dienelactone hydrolase